jgi:hypothetical protein
MPRKIFMKLSNNQTFNHEQTTKNFQPVPSTKSVTIGLNNSMISRVYTAKPGCGSCGR